MRIACNPSLRRALLAVLLALASLAQAADIYIPPDLRQWQQWVLHDLPEINCPVAAGHADSPQRSCIWPGQLQLTVTDSGGDFSQSVEVYAESWVWLPGATDLWPQDVAVDGQATAVTEQNQRPAVRLSAGKHEIVGRFKWPRLPESLQLGSGTALVALTVNGERRPRPRWSGDLIWIGRSADASGLPEDNRVAVSVYRAIHDSAPAYVEVTLRIDISGQSREEVIGRLLPDGFAPAEMIAPLPARLDNNGQLRIQARPGNWEFRFRARAPGPLTELVFSPDGENWPQEEIWSFSFDPSLRVAEASASTPVDPVQAGVPPRHQNLPAFRMLPGERLSIVERQRGPSASDKDRLTLNRSLWLDFDRGGFTARDTISGVMVKNWRLDLAPPLALQSGSLTRPDGGTENLLVTENPDQPGHRGVEIRTPRVNLVALSRLEDAAGRLPVSGWDAPLESVEAQLFLPPGNRLVYAAGADYDPRSWLNQWNLLDFFLVLIVTVALWRMYAPWLGLIALAALGLSLQEVGAPVWMWFNLIAALALAKYLPTGRASAVARSYKMASFAIVILWALPFSANQLKLAIYPQLEWAQSAMMGELLPTAAPPMPEMVNVERREAAIEEVVVTGTAKYRDNVLNRYDSDALVQTGPGVPDWGGRQYPLRWTGPVVADQTTRLWIAPPWVLRLWRVAMVVFIFGLLAALLRRDPIRIRAPSGQAAPAMLLIAFAGMMAIFPADDVMAQTPDIAVLEELKTRLSAEPECAPSCVDISRALVRFDAQTLSIELIAHAQTTAAISVPGTSNGWRPMQILMDGKPAETLRLGGSGHYELLLTTGVHRIVLRGALPNSNAAAVAFPQVPRYVEVNGDGWEVTGIIDNRLAGGALTLVRQRDDQKAAAIDDIDVEQFPAFVSVQRALSIDLDWEVTTTVTRLTPKTAAINLTIPLIEGESVTSDNIEVQDSQAIVNLATGQSAVTWRSALVRVPTVTLSAASGQPWQEQWIVSTGASWRLVYSGVPEMIGDHSNEAALLLRFTPWPGEKLVLDINRPSAVAGPTLAIDEAQLVQSVGHRITDNSLTFDYRATRGSQHAITLPANSELESVVSDGQPISLALENSALRLPVTPGAHSYAISWRSADGARIINAGNRPDLGIAASNLSSRIDLPGNRWIIWAYGPTGPAVLYWSELAAFVLVAFALGRFGRTPLKFIHWLLLGLGFSTFFWPAFALVAAALLTHAWRSGHVIKSPVRFDLVQLALAALVVAAGIALVTTIPMGLLGTPDMHIAGNPGWFIDQSDGRFPATGLVSLPLWVYKALILVWALWLAFALMRWLPWMWRAYSHGGFWKRIKGVIAEPHGLS